MNKIITYQNYANSIDKSERNKTIERPEINNYNNNRKYFEDFEQNVNQNERIRNSFLQNYKKEITGSLIMKLFKIIIMEII